MVEHSEKEKAVIPISGSIKRYTQWPIVAAAIFGLASAMVYERGYKIGVLMVAFALVYLVVTVVLYYTTQRSMMSQLIEMAAGYGAKYSILMRMIDIPYAICADDGTILWSNQAFNEITVEDCVGRNLKKCIPAINKGMFPKNEDELQENEIVYNELEYKVTMKCIDLKDMVLGMDGFHKPSYTTNLISVNLLDVTEMNSYIRVNEEQRMVAGMIYIDNYDEVVDSGIEEVRQSLLFALVDRKISNYVGKVNGIVKKIENDKYFIAIQKSGFLTMEEDKFSVLEDVKTISVGNTIPVTLSIGLGLSSVAYSTSLNFARSAIDLALARGGDQVVVKDCNGITYYGGKREQMAKNTRVKARVKAEALRELMLTHGNVFVMGHKLPDVDALGAAIGIYRAAVALDRRAYVILNEVSASLKPLYMAYRENEEYPEDLFIDTETALEYMEDSSLVVVVDTNRPNMVESREVLKAAKTIVTIDHHRQSADNIKTATLSYVEPFASSACEMVSEILQYIQDTIRLPKLDASSMYAGIMIDTNNFVYRTGVRTFEAAAFLRRQGADIALVKKMFRDDMASYKVKAAIIDSAEVFDGEYAIAKNVTTKVESPTILGAQAANDLLDIDGIKASFVLTTYNGKIYVSARSIDGVNVQIAMEKLGGGGHINAAGAQFEHTNIDEAVKAVKDVLRQMKEKGEIL